MDRWLGRGVQLAAIVLLLAVCLVLWQVARLVHRMERGLARVSDHVVQVTETAAHLAERVDHLAARVDELKRNTKETLRVEELQALSRQLADVSAQVIGEGDAAEAAPPEMEAEIAHLLACLTQADLLYRAGDDTDTPAGFALKARMKHRAFARSIDSTERFIDTISREELTGEAYEVRLPDGTWQPVDEWLRVELAHYRERAAQRAGEVNERNETP